MALKLKFVGGLLTLLALSACGVAPGIGPSDPTALTAQSTSTFKYALGADISHDPGVELDAGMSIQAADQVRVDLRPGCSPVADQGQFGACTSFATIKGLEEFLLKKRGRYVPQSPAFLWYESRRETGQKGQDAGVPTEFAVKMLDAYGSLPEAEFPYLAPALQQDEKARDEFLTRQPSSTMINEAKGNRIITGYKTATKLSAVRTSLQEGVPVLLAMKVYASITKTGSDGVLPMPTANDKFEGGHAVLCVGYDNAKRVLIVRNSWGTKWGDAGYFYMPYDYVRQGNVRLAVIPKI